VGVNAITLLLPDLSWYVKFRVEYMAIPAAALLLAFALDAMFKGLLQAWAKRVILAVNAAALLLFLVAPTVFMTRALPYVYAATMLCAAYVLVRFLIGLRARRGVRQIIILCGLVLYFASDDASYTTGQVVCVDGGWTAGFSGDYQGLLTLNVEI